MNDKNFRNEQSIPRDSTSKIFNDGEKITHSEPIKINQEKPTEIKDTEKGDEVTTQLR